MGALGLNLGLGFSTGQGKRLLQPPEDFAFTPTLPIYWHGGKRYSTNFDVATMQHVGAGKTYYVSLSGSNSNDGLTPETAFSTIRYAVERSDVDIVMLAPGTYKRSASDGAGIGQGTIAPTRPISIKAMQQGTVIVALCDSLVWAPVAGRPNTYTATTSESGVRVRDALYVDAYGDYQEYILKATLADTDATPGSYYYSGSTLYVHTSDGRVPDEHIRAYLLSTYAVTTTLGHEDLYLEGIAFEGGSRTLFFQNSASKPTPNLYAKNCTFKYAISGDCVDVDGGGSVILQNCEAARGKNDGFNYHKVNGTIPNVIEINCVGRHNGDGTDSIDNGSSIHDGGKIVRLNCTYHHNAGGNVADICSGTQAWCVGCTSFESVATTEDRYNSCFTAHTEAKMWLEGCVGYNSSHAMTVQDDATIYTRRSTLSGDTYAEGTGSVVPY